MMKIAANKRLTSPKGRLAAGHYQPTKKTKYEV